MQHFMSCHKEIRVWDESVADRVLLPRMSSRALRYREREGGKN